VGSTRWLGFLQTLHCQHFSDPVSKGFSGPPINISVYLVCIYSISQVVTGSIGDKAYQLLMASAAWALLAHQLEYFAAADIQSLSCSAPMVSLRLSRQGFMRRPKVLSILVVSNSELAGRCACVGYSLLGMGQRSLTSR